MRDDVKSWIYGMIDCELDETMPELESLIADGADADETEALQQFVDFLTDLKLRVEEGRFA